MQRNGLGPSAKTRTPKYIKTRDTRAGVAKLFVWWVEKNGLKKLGRNKNVSKKAWRAKVNHMKTHNRATLILNIHLGWKQCVVLSTTKKLLFFFETFQYSFYL